MKKKVLSILLIEDDRIEVMKLKRVLSKEALNHKLIEAKNGEEALTLLRDKSILPDLILLDLNMPKIDGIEFLKILKADETLKYIPTVVLTTSSNHNDVKQCYEIGIAGYVLKPLKYEDYVTKLSGLLNYWSLNELIHL
ncbi:MULTISPECIES: response regulator [Leeuwenhoekiella]|jgi:CheY-like chemotaxis protein|uniref:response regulator n=1 Tax=Leeuwenhoekiella TaxID=283735 RepID=UPI000C4F41F2|nr:MULTISPECIES: response regulator [Leeuwenhoekiella]MAO45478.1 response regulator [Leeuwenhoekiella sp.]HBT10585.1 response regulator [Leeuwenhoekiella sp.]HCW65336.1 response regulator [Leeuwenhoekiella sp.]|tara:strand:+ start:2064 stop:2480 length:417 start_codon:yes stop_codon:yes gene_type:complete